MYGVSKPRRQPVMDAETALILSWIIRADINPTMMPIIAITIMSNIMPEIVKEVM